MQKTIEWLTRWSGSYVAPLVLICALSGGVPAIIIGYFMLVTVMASLAPVDVLVLLSIFLGMMILTLAIAFAGVGGLRKQLRLGSILPSGRRIDAMISNGRIALQDDFFRQILKQKRPIFVEIAKSKKDKVQPRVVTQEEYEGWDEYRRRMVYRYNLRWALRDLERLPVETTIISIFLIVGLLTGPFFFVFHEYLGSYETASFVIQSVGIAQIFFHVFLFVNAELNTAPVRTVVKQILNPEVHHARFSITVKFGLQVFVLVLSLVALFTVMKERTGSSSVGFIIGLLLISVYLSGLYVKDLMQSVTTFANAVRDLGEGGHGELWLASVDKEFAGLGNDFSRAAREVYDIRHNLESLVDQKTAEISLTHRKLKDKADVMEMELNMASSIQRGLLPKIKAWQELEFERIYQPMVKVSGDYYDIFQLDDGKLGVLMADVSGHGIPACLITSMGKLSFLSNTRKTQDTARVMALVNRDLNEHVKTQDYMTAFFLIFDKDYSFEYTNASHQFALHLKNDGTIEELDTNGFFLGVEITGDHVFETKKSKLEPGESLVLYTDGITEERNKEGEEFGHDRFRDFLQKHRNDDVGQLTVQFHSYFFDFVANVKQLTDDLTFLIIRRLPNEDATGSTNWIKHELLEAKRFLKEKNTKQGFAILERLNEEKPGDPQILYPLARREFLRGDAGAARNLLDSIQVGIDDIRNGQLRAKIRELKGRLDGG